MKTYKANKNSYWISLGVGILLFFLTLYLLHIQRYIISLLPGFFSLIFIYASLMVIIKGKYIIVDDEGITFSQAKETKICWKNIKKVDTHEFKGSYVLIIEVDDFNKYPKYQRFPKDILKRMGAKETDIVLGFGGFESEQHEIISTIKEKHLEKTA